jgi:hypothetical protein
MQYSSIYNLDKEPIEVDQWTELKNGVSIDSRMTKQLVIKALEDAINRKWCTAKYAILIKMTSIS